MGQLENGDDKDFVLSNSYQDNDTLGSREDVYHGSGSSASGAKAFKHIYIAIGGFLILIVLSVVLIARTYSLAEKVQLLAMESRLEQMENRLGSVEGEGGLSQNAGSGNQLILLTERLDQLEANLTARINSMANQLNTAALKPAPQTTTKAETPSKAKTGKTVGEVKKETPPKTHIVKKGDTLYRISRRYNLSVEQLRQYNQLGKKASIYPGQELKVSSPK
jgi:LysM repeat protein